MRIVSHHTLGTWALALAATFIAGCATTYQSPRQRLWKSSAPLPGQAGRPWIVRG
ncbi:hypothetical protein HNQ60_001784 [Povalibacter uvarum]|uniref:Uncharacterized protein n=1 Tax=Povalibacter uvarum TaxID=732238 RepID=A0A841HJD2_9GAMM|nr:hypothetical protein [Povalibacter uvarum]